MKKPSNPVGLLGFTVEAEGIKPAAPSNPIPRQVRLDSRFYWGFRPAVVPPIPPDSPVEGLYGGNERDSWQGSKEPHS